jgi:hypothetical protein
MPRAATCNPWWGANNPIPERSAQKILKVADAILKAGSDAEPT